MLFVQVPLRTCLRHAQFLTGSAFPRPRTCLSPALTRWLQPQLRTLCSLPRSAHTGPLPFRSVDKTLSPSSRLFTASRQCKQHCYHTQHGSQSDKSNKSGLFYICAIGMLMLGGSYAAVPLYQRFCQVTGRGGQAVEGHDDSKVESMNPVKERVIRVRFTADTASSMQWNFRPEQSEVRIVPGETALAFYKAKNPTDKPIIGISTYNIIPYEAGAYFNKIQCFCFEEQRLNPKEEVDMPVFFYIDPEFAEDHRLASCDQILLSYTFFEAKEGVNIPLPAYMTEPIAQ